MTRRLRTGGRSKRVANGPSAAKVAEIAASGETPLDFMLRAMRDPTLEFSDRMEMAKTAAPYVHPRMAQVEPPEPIVEEPFDPSDPQHKIKLARELVFLIAEGKHAEQLLELKVTRGNKNDPAR